MIACRSMITDGSKSQIVGIKDSLSAGGNINAVRARHILNLPRQADISDAELPGGDFAVPGWD